MNPFIKIIFITLFTFNATIIFSQSTNEKELLIDLASIGISDRIEIMPAAFHTITANFTIIDTIAKEGYYLHREHTWIEKDEYETFRVILGERELRVKEELIIKLAGVESVLVERKIKKYKTYHLCNFCDESYGISFNEIANAFKINPKDYKEGEKYTQEFSGLRKVRRGNPYPDYSNGGQILRVVGTKQELKQLLKDPILEGVKYEWRDL